MTAPAIPLASDLTPEFSEPAHQYSWLQPLQDFSRGLLWSAVIVSALLAVEFDLGFPRIFMAGIMGFLGFAIVSLGDGIANLLWKILGLLFSLLHFSPGRRVLKMVPPTPIGRIFGAFFYIAGDMLWPESFFQYITLPVVWEITIFLGGFSVMMVGLARVNGRSRPAKLTFFGLPLILILVYAFWVINPGFDNYLAAPVTAESPTLSLENPGLPGPYTVHSLTYGSGTNERRPEFGADADLITPVLDGTPIFAGYNGLTASYFQWYWGFDFSQLPLNGTVWYPDGDGPFGDGPFPLVLILHGNHAMSDYSDPGYAYLAEHLASQGYIAVSVDENFLNGLYFFDGNMDEMPLRGWLLLQHLAQWQAWNGASDTPFSGKVDMNQIALIGHSRGGEAVAWAAHMNWESMVPVSAVSTPDDFGFTIRGVVAIAPSDTYGGEARKRPTLDHTNYLLLGGGHDADTFVLYGQQQYNRVRFDENPDGFKALAYVYQANHGQFNTVWGDSDRGIYNSWLLNRRPLLSAEEQEQTARVLITGFLNAALRGQGGYRGLFQQPAAAAVWLPDQLIVTQYQEATFIPIDTNRGSTTLAATDFPGAQASSQGTSLAKVEALHLRDGETLQNNKALHLAWEAGSAPVYEVRLPSGDTLVAALSNDDTLTFALAIDPSLPRPQTIFVELETTTGETVRLTLNDYSPVIPALPVHLVKASWLAGLHGFPGKMTPEEIVLQTYTLPLAAFQTAEPAFQLSRLQTIRFLFDGNSAGAIYLDEIGFSGQS